MPRSLPRDRRRVALLRDRGRATNDAHGRLPHRVRQRPTRQARRHRRPARAATFVTLTYAELDARDEPARQRAARPRRRPGQSKVVWCGQNSIGVVAIDQRGAQARRHRGAAELPAAATRRRPTSPTTATPPSSTSTPSSRRCSSGSAAEIPKVQRRPGLRRRRRPTGMTDVDDADRRRVDRRARGRRRRPPRPGATMIYTSGTTGKPKGALRRGAADPAQVAAMLAAHRLHARRRLHHHRPALPLAAPAASWASRRRSARRSCCSASSTPRTGCASSRSTRCTSTFSRADADPHGLQPARRGEGEVRPSSMRRHDRQRRAVELRAQAACTSPTSRRTRCSRCTARPSSA